MSSMLPRNSNLVYRREGQVVFQEVHSDPSPAPGALGWCYIFENNDVLDEVLSSTDPAFSLLQDHVRMCRKYESLLAVTIDELMSLMELSGIVERKTDGDLYRQLTRSTVRINEHHGLIPTTLIPGELLHRPNRRDDDNFLFLLQRCLAHHQQVLQAMRREENTLCHREVLIDYDKIMAIKTDYRASGGGMFIVPRNRRRRPITRGHHRSWRSNSKPYAAKVYDVDTPSIGPSRKNRRKTKYVLQMPLDVLAAVS